jgi:hypothetical protein
VGEREDADGEASGGDNAGGANVPGDAAGEQWASEPGDHEDVTGGTVCGPVAGPTDAGVAGVPGADRGSITRRRDGGIDIGTGSVVVSVVGDRRVDARDIADALVAFVVERSKAPFERGLEALRAYVAENNNADIQRKYVTADGYRLGSFVHNLRTAYKAKTLLPERVRQLDVLGMVWDLPDAAFERGFEALRAYVVERGHADVFWQHITAAGYRLGPFVSEQRKAYKAGRLTPERVRRLEELGVVWDLYDTAFERGLDALVAYVAENGSADVPRRYTTADAFRLGVWLSSKRTAYKAGRLSPERVRQLEELGVRWRTR